MFLGLPDPHPDPLLTSMDPDPHPLVSGTGPDPHTDPDQNVTDPEHCL